MPSTEISITLPERLAAFVRARVASGQYASESDVVQDSIEQLIEREVFVDDRIKADVAAAYDHWKANPSTISTVGEVVERFEARWAAEDEDR